MNTRHILIARNEITSLCCIAVVDTRVDRITPPGERAYDVHHIFTLQCAKGTALSAIAGNLLGIGADLKAAESYISRINISLPLLTNLARITLRGMALILSPLGDLESNLVETPREPKSRVYTLGQNRCICIKE